MKPIAEPSVQATVNSKSVVIRLEEGGFKKSTKEIADEDSPSLKILQGGTGRGVPRDVLGLPYCAVRTACHTHIVSFRKCMHRVNL